MSYTPFYHVPRDARPTPPPATVQVAGRLFSTRDPERLRQAAANMPDDWARMEAVVREHCPDATATSWRPAGQSRCNLGVWTVRVRERSGTARLQRAAAIERAIGPLRVTVEVVG